MNKTVIKHIILQNLFEGSITDEQVLEKLKTKRIDRQIISLILDDLEIDEIIEIAEDLHLSDIE